jgi:hypothetical protein
MVLNIGLDVLFDNMGDWKEMRERAGEFKVRSLCNKLGDFPLNPDEIYIFLYLNYFGEIYI